MDKPTKPTPDFPLTARNNGQWAKKVKGKFYYFGPWADPQGALNAFNAWLAGKPAKPTVKGKPKNGRPDKPYKDFPLYAHSNGQWAKKVRGLTRLFGPWADPQAALDKWLEQKDDLLAGREPRVTGEGLTVESLVNQFLETKENLVDNGELTRRHWEDYKVTGTKLIEVFGRKRLVTDLRPDDFEKLRKEFTKGHGRKRRGHGPTTLTNDIGRARAFFNYAGPNGQGLIDRPVVFGDGFKKPSQRVLRVERQKKGKKMFTAKQIRAMIGKAGPQLKAMILLGINCGMGNTDCATLTLPILNLKTGWLDYGRRKTGIERRCRLWPETINALTGVLTRRRAPKDKAHADRVFITKYGHPWTAKAKTGDCPISKETAKLLKELKIHRPGLGFYTLRHTFETIGGESMDQAAVDRIMGHAPHSNDMSAIYRERMTNKRLHRVANHVRKWLFRRKPCESSAAPSSPEPAAE
jgi:integrase